MTSRGAPIDRSVGQRPDPAWAAAAAAYVEAEHTGFILAYVRGLNARHIPEEDLVQAARIGAIRALETFDLDKAGRFLTHGRWGIRCETGKLLNRGESLVHVPPEVRRAREALLRQVPPEMSDEDAAAAVGLPVERVRELRSIHLGHAHRQVDERAGGVRRGLREVAQAAADRRAAVRAQVAVSGALSRLTPLQRRVLLEDLGAAELLAEDPAARAVAPPKTKVARKMILRRTLDELREELSSDGE